MIKEFLAWLKGRDTWLEVEQAKFEDFKRENPRLFEDCPKIKLDTEKRRD